MPPLSHLHNARQKLIPKAERRVDKPNQAPAVSPTGLVSEQNESASRATCSQCSGSGAIAALSKHDILSISKRPKKRADTPTEKNMKAPPNHAHARTCRLRASRTSWPRRASPPRP